VFGLFQTLASRDGIESGSIGLAMVKKVVEARCGQVWLERAPPVPSTAFRAHLEGTHTLPSQR
jgi:signal transduction histidine kinase